MEEKYEGKLFDVTIESSHVDGLTNFIITRKDMSQQIIKITLPESPKYGETTADLASDFRKIATILEQYQTGVLYKQNTRAKAEKSKHRGMYNYYGRN